jgi:hypothetical protein
LLDEWRDKQISPADYNKRGGGKGLNKETIAQVLSGD